MVKKYILIFVCGAVFVYLCRFDTTRYVEKSIHGLKRGVQSVHFLNALSNDAHNFFLMEEESPNENSEKTEILVADEKPQVEQKSEEPIAAIAEIKKEELPKVEEKVAEPVAVASVPQVAPSPAPQVAPPAPQVPIVANEPKAQPPQPAKVEQTEGPQPVVNNAKPAEGACKVAANTCETGPAVNPIVEQISKTYMPDCKAETTAVKDAGSDETSTEGVTPIQLAEQRENEEEEIAPKPQLKGIVLLSRNETDRNQIPNNRVFGFVSRELPIPDGIKTLKNELEPVFLNRTIDIDLVDDLKRAIAVYYSEHDRPLVTVEIPEQDVTDGVVDVVVNEAKLGGIITRGNYWFSDDKIKRSIRLKPNEPISRKRLLADVTHMNKNPFRHTDVIFTPGSVEGQTDLELVTKDRFPLRFYSGVDNTGTVPLDQNRFFTGFNWGNAFGLDQILTYQATISMDPHQFFSNTVNYVAPLPWRHVLQIYGGYATIHPKVHHFKASGHSFQGSIRYQMPADYTLSSAAYESILGFDFKNTNNFFEFTEMPIYHGDQATVNITQFMVGFNYSREFTRDKFIFSSEVFVSPGQLTARESKKDYSALRPGARSSYVYGKAYFYNDYTFCNASVLSAQARFQASSETLLPSEQYGLGGYDTVRGYDEREVNGDSAICLNLEMRTPNIPIVRQRWDNQEFILLGFTDYGFAYNIRVIDGFPHSQQLASLGVGARYRYGSYASARLDVGYRLVSITEGQDTGFKTHFGVVLSY